MHKSPHVHSTHCTAGTPLEAGDSGPLVRQGRRDLDAWCWAITQNSLGAPGQE